jgi:hypothetical protein
MMKRVVLVAGVMLFALTSAVLACACTSGDGSCSASTNCGGRGCFAICGSGGCTSGCSGGPQQNAPTFSFAGQNVSAADLQQRVNDELGVQFAFAPNKAGDTFTVDVENASATDLMAGLAKIGATAMVDRPSGPEEKAARPFSRRFSLKAENVPTATVSHLLEQIFGESIKVQTADPKGKVSLDLEHVTLHDLQIELPRISGIKVEPVTE